MGEVPCPGSHSSNPGSPFSLNWENYFSDFLVSHLNHRSDNNGTYVLGLEGFHEDCVQVYEL